ncbi:hypothetical protein FPHYL_13363 [Fusarium phyllophilum]|uniref:Uncharacterized protein n=1 Tax=Fusarium phyllophilum TaxID=47803 RepID=A0A8H5ICJ8_9HYPO|nr:hypothetical protein FPHYL_13363 [Fusarium phyllophilum]
MRGGMSTAASSQQPLRKYQTTRGSTPNDPSFQTGLMDLKTFNSTKYFLALRVSGSTNPSALFTKHLIYRACSTQSAFTTSWISLPKLIQATSSMPQQCYLLLHEMANPEGFPVSIPLHDGQQPARDIEQQPSNAQQEIECTDEELHQLRMDFGNIYIYYKMKEGLPITMPTKQTDSGLAISSYTCQKGFFECTDTAQLLKT